MKNKLKEKLNAKNDCRKMLYLILIVLFFGNLNSVFAQNQWKPQDDGCGAVRWMGNPNGAFNLDIKEQTVAAPPKKLTINGATNGGVRVRGWERAEIFIRACVQSAGRDDAEARAKTAAVRIEYENGTLRAVSSEDISFGASFDIRVPVNTDLKITTNNGGINLSNVRGSIEFDLKNGGAVFDRIAGDVRGQTVNGSLVFNLSGDRWEGGGIDVRTTNGNVQINVPENYSARLETVARSRKFRGDFPIAEMPHANGEFNFNLGAGGAVIRATTVNGQISIQRRATIVKEKPQSVK